jgi:hypothetical protein
MVKRSKNCFLSFLIDLNSREENREVAIEGGNVAGDARRNIEKLSGRPVITEKSAVDFTNF